MEKILIIEDDFNLRENLGELFEIHNYEIITAINGLDGIEKAFSKKPDIIICDISMPEMNGFEVLAVLRKNRSTFFTPFLFLSAITDKLNIREGMNLGADDYITKPYENNEILQAVRAKLDKFKSTQSNIESKIKDKTTHIPTNVPFQFRVPLKNVLGFTKLLLNGFNQFPQEEVLSILKNINESAERLLKMIDNYSYISKFENPNVDIFKNAIPYFNIEELIIQKANFYANKYGKNKFLGLIVDEMSQTTVKINAEDLHKIIDELFDNVFRYSYDNKMITIIGRKNKHNYEIITENSSKGINADLINNIGIVSAPVDQEFELQSVGLGLTLINKISEAYNGKCIINSIPYEKTNITVILPI